MTETSLAPIAAWGCKDCAFLEPCGGIESQQQMFGCFGGCGPCDSEACDYTCPKKPASFWRDWVEVGGINPRQRRDLPSPTSALPRYLPMIHHGFSRRQPLPFNVVAVNTFDVIDSQSHCKPAVDSPDGLRAHFKLGRAAKVLLVSVNKDSYLESFWRYKDPDRLSRLARLGLLGITTPNYSFFEDAPRLHTLRNLWRIVRCAEGLANAGLHPVLHVNALTSADWKTWAKVLKEAPGARHVCKEFQTGLSHPDRANEAVDALSQLQDQVGRSLHPIAVGGRQVASKLARRFSAFTVVDSEPFFASINRKRITISGTSKSRVDNPTDAGEPIDDLLQDNIRTYTRLVEECAAFDPAQV